MEALGDERRDSSRAEGERERGRHARGGGGERIRIQGLTTSLFRPAVYQLQTKGLKVYAPLNKFATISRLPTPSVLVPATLHPCSLLFLSHRATFAAQSKIP